MTRIAISVLVLALAVSGRSWAAQPHDQEAPRTRADMDANPTDQSDDPPAEEPVAAVAGSTAQASSRMNVRAWHPDPSPTRLIVGPTARSLERGEVYLDLNGIVGGPFVQVGITDRISIGAGTPVLIPGIRPGEVFAITPKVTLFSGRRTAAAVGVIHASGPTSNAGIAYGVVTRGTGDASVTVGLALPHLWRGERAGSAPVVMLGGEKRVTQKVKLISENFLAIQGGILGGGVRIIRGQATFDLGVGVPLGSGFVIPMFRLARKF